MREGRLSRDVLQTEVGCQPRADNLNDLRRAKGDIEVKGCRATRDQDLSSDRMSPRARGLITKCALRKLANSLLEVDAMREVLSRN